MSRRKKGVGWEARIATPPEYRFVEFEGDADAVATIFVNRDEGDIDIDGANFDVVELVFLLATEGCSWRIRSGRKFGRAFGRKMNRPIFWQRIGEIVPNISRAASGIPP